MVYFDQLKRDEGYAAVIENVPEEMVCSHQVKRFFKAFLWLCRGVFLRILKRLFIWRLKIERPEKIELTIDLMIMDNDEAEERHGVEPTYKKEFTCVWSFPTVRSSLASIFYDWRN